MTKSKTVEIIGKNIRYFRHEKDWTIDQLSEKCALSPSYMGLIERGKRETSISALDKISGVLSISIMDLFFTGKLPKGHEKVKLLEELQVKLKQMSTKKLKSMARIIDEVNVI